MKNEGATNGSDGIWRGTNGSRRAVVDMDKKRIEVHICPILMRTVRFFDGQCEQKDCSEEDECPIQEEIKRNAMENPPV